MSQTSLVREGIKLLPSPVTGFRVWTVKNEGLFPLNEDYGEWQPGVNKAVCRKDPVHHHYPAERGCGCGYWIKKSLEGAMHYLLKDPTLYIIGCAMGWGKTQHHVERNNGEGWRCEFASPLAFGLTNYESVRPRDAAEWARLSKHPAMSVRLLAMRYDVPLVGVENLEQWYQENVSADNSTASTQG